MRSCSAIAPRARSANIHDQSGGIRKAGLIVQLDEERSAYAAFQPPWTGRPNRVRGLRKRDGLSEPIRPELRPLDPPHWRELSRHVRFERAEGRCQRCHLPPALGSRGSLPRPVPSLDRLADIKVGFGLQSPRKKTINHAATIAIKATDTDSFRRLLAQHDWAASGNAGASGVAIGFDVPNLFPLRRQFDGLMVPDVPANSLALLEAHVRGTPVCGPRFLAACSYEFISATTAARSTPGVGSMKSMCSAITTTKGRCLLRCVHRALARGPVDDECC